MGDVSVRLKRAAEARRKPEPEDYKIPTAPVLPASEQEVLDTLRAEVERRGAGLHYDEREGVAPSQAIEVLRRDGFRCRKCGIKTDIALRCQPAWLTESGHADDQKGLVVLCNTCVSEVRSPEEAANGD